MLASAHAMPGPARGGLMLRGPAGTAPVEAVRLATDIGVDVSGRKVGDRLLLVDGANGPLTAGQVRHVSPSPMRHVSLSDAPRVPLSDAPRVSLRCTSTRSPRRAPTRLSASSSR